MILSPGAVQSDVAETTSAFFEGQYFVVTPWSWALHYQNALRLQLDPKDSTRLWLVGEGHLGPGGYDRQGECEEVELGIGFTVAELLASVATAMHNSRWIARPPMP